MSKGYIHIYTGNGKGKTTASIGLIIRALGHNKKIAMVQFMKKDENYGEYRYLHNKIALFQVGRNEFVDFKNPAKIDIELAQKGLEKAKKLIFSDEYDMIVLDEINVSIMFRLINEKDIIMIMKEKPERLELILTGRGATKEMINNADLVSEMKEIKHYYNKGIDGREGIEY